MILNDINGIIQRLPDTERKVFIMGKEAKTNAMRILDRNNVSYEEETCEVKEFTDGLELSKLMGHDPACSFKTLVTQGKSGSYYVFVLPVAEEVDFKAAAKAVDEKSVEMIHVKDINKITGYVRGGCSPLGMKKQFRTVIDDSAEKFDKIYVSGGRIGSHIKLAPADLAKVTSALFADIKA